MGKTSFLLPAFQLQVRINYCIIQRWYVSNVHIVPNIIGKVHVIKKGCHIWYGTPVFP